MHLDRNTLLQLELVQLLTFGLADRLFFHLFLEFKHLDHTALLAQHELGDLLAVFVTRQEWCHVDICLCPVDSVAFGRVDVWEGEWLREIMIFTLKTTYPQGCRDTIDRVLHWSLVDIILEHSLGHFQ